MDANLKARFWNEGYFIGNVNLSKKTLRAALAEVTDLPFGPIFGEVYEEERDPNRHQSSISTFGKVTEKIYKTVKNIVALSEPEWYTKRSIWYALKSLPGGLRQGIHRDYPSNETNKAILEKDVVQASVIIALMDNTHFVIYPGCFGTYVDRNKYTLVTLKAGEFLLFRGDLVHASAEFKETNIRLHCFVRVRGIKQRRDATEAVVFSTYMCEHCAMKCDSLLHRRNHQRYCQNNPNKASQQKQRGKADDRGGRCDECNVAYKKHSAYHQHNHRCHPKKPKKVVRGGGEEPDMLSNMEEQSSEEEDSFSEENSEDEVNPNGGSSEEEANEASNEDESINSSSGEGSSDGAREDDDSEDERTEDGE